MGAEAPLRPQRHFLALAPDAPARAALAAEPCPDGARPVPAADLHVTLLFLGTLAPEREPDVLQAMRAVPAGAVRVRFDRLECWAGPRAWVAVPAVEERSVADLAEAFAAALLPLVGDRLTAARKLPFRTHLTIARRVPGAPAPTSLAAPVEWQAREVLLMASGLPGPTRYSRRGVVPLGLRGAAGSR